MANALGLQKSHAVMRVRSAKVFLDYGAKLDVFSIMGERDKSTKLSRSPSFLTRLPHDLAHLFPIYSSKLLAGWSWLGCAWGCDAGKSFVLAAVGREGLLCLAAISSFPDKASPIPCPMIQM